MYVIVTENEKELVEALKGQKIKIIEIDNGKLDVVNNTSSRVSAFSNIDEFLLELGIRPHIKGFAYLQYIFSKNMKCSSGITTKLYPAVAAKFDTTPGRVERAIRHAIKTAYENPDGSLMFKNMFGIFGKKPTNSQFFEGCRLYLKNNPID